MPDVCEVVFQRRPACLQQHYKGIREKWQKKKHVKTRTTTTSSNKRSLAMLKSSKLTRQCQRESIHVFAPLVGQNGSLIRLHGNKLTFFFNTYKVLRIHLKKWDDVANLHTVAEHSQFESSISRLLQKSVLVFAILLKFWVSVYVSNR